MHDTEDAERWMRMILEARGAMREREGARVINKGNLS